MANSVFTVVDVETTGLFPGRSDRIIEVVVISLDFEGNILREYETLINPERDLGPTHLHHITAAMVKNAPKFSEILGDLVDHFAGTILVGHNVSFDYKFLRSEFLRSGIALPEIPYVCTLNLSKKVDPNIPSGKLEALCEYFDIPLANSHCAYTDCEATAKLFQILLREYSLQNVLQMTYSPLDKRFWPSLPKSNLFFKRSNFGSMPKEKSYIGELVTRLPIIGETKHEGELAYLHLLDEILADRRISTTESQCLFDLALEYNITQSQAIELHKQHLSDLIRIALLDGTISDFETQDLIQVADLLNISELDLSELISRGEMGAQDTIKEGSLEFSREKSKLVGQTVCFTGTLLSKHNGMPITREMAQKLALEHGLVIKKGVTQDLDILVTSDPDSMSGKAKKAREYNIRIMAEQAFWTMLGIQVS